MKSDFVRRPGHGGKQVRSRNAPTSAESVKKNEEVGEFSPTNWSHGYTPDKPIHMTCIHCGKETYMYYSFIGEDFYHVLQCSICGEDNGPVEDGT